MERVVSSVSAELPTLNKRMINVFYVFPSEAV